MDYFEKLERQTYVREGNNEYCGYIAYKYDENITDHDLADILKLENKFYQTCNKNFIPNKNKNIPGRISYFYKWNDGIAQIGFSTYSLEDAIHRADELKTILSFGKYIVTPKDIKIENEIY